jgi:RHS repeat-associated protein
MAGVSYSGSSAHSVSYTYDADGQKTGMTDATGPSGDTYDPFGELTSVTNGAGQTVTYSYDADGDSTGITYPLPSGATWATSSTVSYGYDNAGQLTSVTDFNGNTITIANTGDGLPSAETLASTGDTITTTYDNADSSSVIALKNSTSTLQSFAYADAPSGDALTETDTPSSSVSPATYSYDASDRVTSMTTGSGSAHGYGFDASSNLTALPTGGTGSYDQNGELASVTLSGTTTSYSYNANGERLSAVQGGSTITSGTWNGAAQLTSYADSASGMTGASYSGDGLRASDTVGIASQSFTWDTTTPVNQLLMDSASAYIYEGPAGITPAEQVNLTSGAVTYLVTDSLGSTRGAVSNSGALTATTSYDAWGNPETTGGLSASTPFGYAGGYTDPDGLIYLLARYYDPATGQFLSGDPDVTQTQEPYAYAGDNPITNSDPTGMDWRLYSSKTINYGWHSLLSGGPIYTYIKNHIQIGFNIKIVSLFITIPDMDYINKVVVYRWYASAAKNAKATSLFRTTSTMSTYYKAYWQASIDLIFFQWSQSGVWNWSNTTVVTETSNGRAWDGIRAPAPAPAPGG